MKGVNAMTYESRRGERLDDEMDITQNDMERSRTTRNIEEFLHIIDQVRPLLVGNKRMLDVGCGFGGLSTLVGKRLAFQEVYGIDIDSSALVEAGKKGVIIANVEVGEQRLPYESDYFDFVINLGMLDYLPFFDDALVEFYRVLKPSGHLLVSLPNLASWHNRIALLLGYQPRDIEVSRQYVVGVHPVYHRNGALEPTGHIHTATTGAFKDLCERFGFKTVEVWGFNPAPNRSLLARIMDRIMTRNPSLARRFVYVGRK